MQCWVGFTLLHCKILYLYIKALKKYKYGYCTILFSLTYDHFSRDTEGEYGVGLHSTVIYRHELSGE